MAFLETVSATINLAKGLPAAIGSLSTIELKQRMLDLLDRMLNMKAEALELAQQNDELRARVRELERGQQVALDVYHEDSVAWRRTQDGREGPYCPVCWDSKQTLVHLSPGATKGTYSCGVCQNGFSTAPKWKDSPSTARFVR